MHVLALPERPVGLTLLLRHWRPVGLRVMGEAVQIFPEQAAGIRITQHLHACLVDPCAVAFQIHAADRLSRGIQKEVDMFFLFAQSHFSLCALSASSQSPDSIRQIVRQFGEQPNFLRAECIRLGGIDYDGSENSGVEDQRD